MNLILFEPGEWENPLSSADRRSVHILQILKLAPGDTFCAGEIGGKWGTLSFVGHGDEGLTFASPDFFRSSAPAYPLGLLIGTPRPPTAQRLLRDLTSLGVSRIVFVATDLGEKSYLHSNLWKSDWKIALIDGAMQAKTTFLPCVERFDSLGKALRGWPVDNLDQRFVFDVSGESFTKNLAQPVHKTDQEPEFIWAALGPERGWSEKEKLLLRSAGWSFVNLGDRILRTETACTVATSLILNRVLGCF